MNSTQNEFLFTSESVTEGHPDKIADQISDGVLDAVMRDDPMGRVACETLVNTGLVVVSGEITTSTYVDIQDIARGTIERIGYTDATFGFDYETCAVISTIDKQSPDIAQGVDAAFETRSGTNAGDELDLAGAGDQGMMFGYASNETPELMPLPIALAHRLARRLAEVRKAGTVPYLRPDGKTQVSVRYVGGRPVGVEKLLISSQHAEGAEDRIRADLWEHVVTQVVPTELYDGARARAQISRQSDRAVRDRRPDGRLRADWPQDHRRHVRRYGPPRRWGIFRQGPLEGRSLGCVRGALCGQEPRRRRGRRPARGSGGVCDWRRATGVGDGRDVRDRARIAHEDPRADLRALRPAPRGVPRLPAAAPSDLPEDRRVRSLRARRRRLHLGADWTRPNELRAEAAGL